MGGWVPFLIALLLNYVQPKHDVEVERFVEAWPVPVEAKTDSLLYVQVAWRHGDRTPAISVPFSDADTWNEGLGELTKRGIAQQYRLGKWLRARYGKWLGDHFDRSQVFVRSSDYNRTLMSAQANMAGLFPPSKLEMWDAGLAWQPVPVHSIPKSIDKELYEDIECPTASAEFNKVWKLGVVRRMEAENEDLIQYLREHSQIVDFQFYMLWMVYDNLFCMHQHNDTQTWPSWMNVTLFNRLQKLYDASSRLKYHTEVLRRLRGGDIGLVVHPSLVYLVDSHEILSPSLTILRLFPLRSIAISIISSYSPTSTGDKSEMTVFYEELVELVRNDKSF
ncbi:hypothetical protein RB195_010252 [Necator americanus]|uniref:Histidine acid phosphatase n=1 Tax=Necator americanus TaxID=51031 RepID=A0ABR1CYD2_NECAM